MKAKILICLVSVLIIAMTGSARADYLEYTYSTHLGLVSGTDAAGLNGATFTLNAKFSITDQYTNQFTYPAVTADLGATYTISGSSVLANNGTFALPSLTYYPSYEGAYSDLFTTSGDQIYANLSGGNLLLDFTCTPTALGLAAQVGDTINVQDFGTISQLDNWYASNGATKYAQVDPTAAATIVTSAVPEPSALVLFGIAGVAGLIIASARRARKGEGDGGNQLITVE